MTLSEVARKAGISRATMYRRFDSRDALIGALVAAELGALERLLTGRMRFADEPRQTVYMLVREVLDANAHNEPLQAALRIDGAALLPLLIRSGSAPTLVDVVTQRALAHITDSPLAEKLTPDPEAAVEFMVSAIYAQLLSPGLYLSHGQLATYVSEAVVRE
ncbi:putative TetR family transcriptional regulator [Gordonia hirsuta DSM 44140 = NBRC 16056]|uniref:Putative TetR family transcriptional regulator n=2 Tax=Gordonia hirsuta TaxID=53427 RepID=L7LF54_9ACTN|nr:putative TetR family transcriptional regulator [Gordonia hirsuta DSM 44140 = NBRC 16056]